MIATKSNSCCSEQKTSYTNKIVVAVARIEIVDLLPTTTHQGIEVSLNLVTAVCNDKGHEVGA